jgi:ketosteroid isomerase-like protein
MSRALLALAPVTLLAACGAAAVDQSAALDAVHATEQAQLQAIADKDLHGAVRNYRDDAVLVAPGSAPATTGDAIAAEFDELIGDANLKIELEPGPGWVSESGELAVTTSTGRMTTTDPASGQPVVSRIGNQTVWQKPTGKPWQIVSDYNVALPDEQQVADAAK